MSEQNRWAEGQTGLAGMDVLPEKILPVKRRTVTTIEGRSICRITIRRRRRVEISQEDLQRNGRG